MIKRVVTSLTLIGLSLPTHAKTEFRITKMLNQEQIDTLMLEGKLIAHSIDEKERILYAVGTKLEEDYRSFLPHFKDAIGPLPEAKAPCSVWSAACHQIYQDLRFNRYLTLLTRILDDHRQELSRYPSWEFLDTYDDELGDYRFNLKQYIDAGKIVRELTREVKLRESQQQTLKLLRKTQFDWSTYHPAPLVHTGTAVSGSYLAGGFITDSRLKHTGPRLFTHYSNVAVRSKQKVKWNGPFFQIENTGLSWGEHHPMRLGIWGMTKQSFVSPTLNVGEVQELEQSLYDETRSAFWKKHRIVRKPYTPLKDVLAEGNILPEEWAAFYPKYVLTRLNHLNTYLETINKERVEQIQKEQSVRAKQSKDWKQFLFLDRSGPSIFLEKISIRTKKYLKELTNSKNTSEYYPDEDILLLGHKEKISEEEVLAQYPLKTNYVGERYQYVVTKHALINQPIKIEFLNYWEQPEYMVRWEGYRFYVDVFSKKDSVTHYDPVQLRACSQSRCYTTPFEPPYSVMPPIISSIY